MFQHLQKLKPAILFAVAFAWLIACKDAGFQSGSDSGTKINDIDSPYIADSNGVVTQTFELMLSASKKVDMVWIIDQSTSMSQEIANVRSNFNSFIANLSASTNLKLALIADPDVTTYGIRLPVAGPNYAQIPHRVQSNDALIIGALAGCPPDTNNLAQNILCGQQVSGVSSNVGFMSTLNGKLSGFFRADAHRVYVIVTDDNALKVNASNFIGLVKVNIQNNTPVVYAFRGFGTVATGCATYSIGVDYQKLADQTGGKTFDICEKNWSKHFSDLTTSVERIAKTEFILAKEAQAILEVRLDGVLIAESLYQLIGNKAKINPVVFDRPYQKISIRYQTN